MFYHQWESENLVYSKFKDDEVLLAKSLFDKNACCQNVDPTFQVWPESEYLALIQKSAATKTAKDVEAFYLLPSTFYLLPSTYEKYPPKVER
ncbi:putative spermine/spermidine acetyltransferase BltD [Vibrio nigripulchritudo ATCC 27043]|uniref:hypothetical protein n=1 Tax=Vibrio nigripulchritudo TaxID=28173 RepID=UPI00021C1B2D|nr:hypothetical protein [Vibrio nigripulchritudo]EGU61697.1 putative spermine/spermidine acetyltransferase BltD [Vibrio nigripulchritudo ATCC 27043]